MAASEDPPPHFSLAPCNNGPGPAHLQQGLWDDSTSWKAGWGGVGHSGAQTGHWPQDVLTEHTNGTSKHCFTGPCLRDAGDADASPCAGEGKLSSSGRRGEGCLWVGGANAGTGNWTKYARDLAAAFAVGGEGRA